MKKFSVEDAKNYEGLLKASKSIFDVGFTKLADKPFNSFFFMSVSYTHLTLPTKA